MALTPLELPVEEGVMCKVMAVVTQGLPGDGGTGRVSKRTAGRAVVWAGSQNDRI